jgi:ATP-dependent Clp protease adaptor protein ClpS
MQPNLPHPLLPSMPVIFCIKMDFFTITITKHPLARLAEIVKFVKSNSMASPRYQTKPAALEMEDTDLLTAHESPYSLIVWNDEVNTFEWVIQALIEICQHSTEQAEQCAMIIHTQGKYAVKQGLYEELKPMCDAITERGIGATIEILSES